MNAVKPTTPASATQQIRSDHAEVLELFHSLTPETDPAERRSTIESLCAALDVHARLEAEIFYPALRDGGLRSAALDRSADAHANVSRLLDRLRRSARRPAQDDALHELMNAVMHHLADVETQLLPAADRFLGPERLAELGAEMAARRLELATAAARSTTGGSVTRTALFAAGALAAGALLVSAVLAARRSATAGNSSARDG